MAIEQVSVNILERSFTINTPEQEREVLLKAIDLLKQKIEVVRAAAPNMDSEKVAIMAALNLTHDLFIQNNVNQTSTALANGDLPRKITKLLEQCDEALVESNS